MNVLLLNGSPKANGCTFTALCEVEKALNENGITTEIIHAGGKNTRGCMACGKCRQLHICVFDDLVNETAKRFADADGLVIGSPVYYASPNGELLSFLDRMFYSSFGTDKRMKVGASIVSARRGGCTSSFDVLNKYFTISGMPVASASYWNMVHGNTPDEVLQDEEGLQIMRVVGQHMAFLIKSIALGKKEFGLPEREARKFTNYIR